MKPIHPIHHVAPELGGFGLTSFAKTKPDNVCLGRVMQVALGGGFSRMNPVYTFLYRLLNEFKKPPDPFKTPP